MGKWLWAGVGLILGLFRCVMQRSLEDFKFIEQIFCSVGVCWFSRCGMGGGLRLISTRRTKDIIYSIDTSFSLLYKRHAKKVKADKRREGKRI